MHEAFLIALWVVSVWVVLGYLTIKIEDLTCYLKGIWEQEFEDTLCKSVSDYYSLPPILLVVSLYRLIITLSARINKGKKSRDEYAFDLYKSGKSLRISADDRFIKDLPVVDGNEAQHLIRNGG